jgi:hypothetical protein
VNRDHRVDLGPLEPVQVDQVVLVVVDDDRGHPRDQHGLQRGEERVRGKSDPRRRRQVERAQRHPQRRRARRDPDGPTATEGVGGRCLELLELGAQDEPAAFHEVLDARR